MSCCCEKTYLFCTLVNSCEPDSFFNLFEDLDDGTYTIQLDYLDSVISIEITVAANDVTGEVDLNESYSYTGKVINDAGEVVPFVIDEVSYDCFQFKTTMQYA